MRQTLRPPTLCRRRALLRLLVGVSQYALAVSCTEQRPDLQCGGAFSGSQAFRFGNDVVLAVEADRVEYVWDGFHLRTGSAATVPWERLELRSGVESHVVSDKGVGNNALVVDGIAVHLRARSQEVLLKIGTAPKVADVGGALRNAPRIHEMPGCSGTAPSSRHK